MSPSSIKKATALALGVVVLISTGCESGSDGTTGAVGPSGPAGPTGPTVINASTTSFDQLAQLDIESRIVSVTIESPPVVRFRVETAQGVPITGLVPYWAQSNRFVRFTLTKLVPGQNGDPDTWVAYVRDNGEPDYDTGESLVDHEDGSYSFTFTTDVTNVAGVTYEPFLTHRVAGQIGRYRTVPLEEQNLWYDFVPEGGPLSLMRNIATMQSCNECHDNLVFHGRRFEVEYCVQCHNPDLAQGEGNFSFMIHRIHNSGTFNVLEGGISFSELTYPQDVINCRKCHNDADPETPEADNWRTKPNMTACAGCHDNFGPNAMNMHSGPLGLTNNSSCTQCHDPDSITSAHTTLNATINNPELLPNQRDIAYELIEATVDGNNDVTVQFKILSGGSPLDLTNLPGDFRSTSGSVFRWPGFLLAWAMPQDGVMDPGDYNNMGRPNAQPLSLSLGNFSPMTTGTPIGTMSFDGNTGINTAVITDSASQFPVGSTLRAVGLQGYLRQDLDGDGSWDASLHTPSDVVGVTGDKARRSIVDTTGCTDCHEWFEGHGGNRVVGPGSEVICTMCHVPNQSSSGRTITSPSASLIALLGNDPLVYPEDAQNFRDLVHGIHSSGYRTRDYEHVRPGMFGGYYNWSHVTFPRGAETNNCALCHQDGTIDLPLGDDLLSTTVRTTSVATGLDPDNAAVTGAFQNLPNPTDWVNTKTAGACFYCHTSLDAWGHMVQNGGLLSVPNTGPWTNRSSLGGNLESCAVCHGPGRIADLNVVHNK